jgi:hypothetical protein
MNGKNNGPNHHAACDVIESQIDPFIAGLKTAGYAANTLCTKRAALRRFVSWRRCLKRPATEPDESEVIDFMGSSPQYGRTRRCLASAALLAFLEHLRRHEVITTCAPEAPTASSAMERRYADFLRNEKGLAELSLHVYLPLVQGNRQVNGKDPFGFGNRPAVLILGPAGNLRGLVCGVDGMFG